MSRCSRCCEAEDNDDKPRLPIAGLSLWEPPGFGDPNMDERDTLDNCRCKLGPANTFESRLLDEVVELISSSSSEASSSGCSAMRDSRLDVGAAPSSKSCAGSDVIRGHQRPSAAPSSKSCAGSDGSIRLRPSIICTQTQSERRPHARAAREAMAFSGPFEGHQRVIRGPSAGHSRAISGPFEGHQRAIRGPSSMAKPIRRPSRGSLEGPCTHLLSRVRLMRYAIRRIQWQSAHLLGCVRLRIRHRLPPFLLDFGRDLEKLLLGRHLMRDAIICTQTQSEFPLDAIKHRSPRFARARARFACTGAARQYRLG